MSAGCFEYVMPIYSCKEAGTQFLKPRPPEPRSYGSPGCVGPHSLLSILCIEAPQKPLPPNLWLSNRWAGKMGGGVYIGRQLGWVHKPRALFTREAEMGGLWVQDLPGLQSEFKISLDNLVRLISR